MREDEPTERRPSSRGAAALCALAMALATPALTAETLSYSVDKASYSVRDSLTGVPGDAQNGRVVAANRKKGNCLACHEMPIPEESFHGRIGPALAGVGSRYDAGQLRLRVVDPKLLNPMSIMPAFYKTDGLHLVAKKFQGQPILTAQEIEDVVAYLTTLK